MSERAPLVDRALAQAASGSQRYLIQADGDILRLRVRWPDPFMVRRWVRLFAQLGMLFTYAATWHDPTDAAGFFGFGCALFIPALLYAGLQKVVWLTARLGSAHRVVRRSVEIRRGVVGDGYRDVGRAASLTVDGQEIPQGAVEGVAKVGDGKFDAEGVAYLSCGPNGVYIVLSDHALLVEAIERDAKAEALAEVLGEALGVGRLTPSGGSPNPGHPRDLALRVVLLGLLDYAVLLLAYPIVASGHWLAGPLALAFDYLLAEILLGRTLRRRLGNDVQWRFLD